jgi:Cu-Zn family superoxide dismutase
MKNLRLVTIIFVLVFVTSCKKEKKEKKEVEEVEVEKIITETEKKLVINLSPKSDSKVEGIVTFKEKAGIVSMTAKLTGLTEGEHAIHIHEKADCSSPDGKSSGGHWNPTGQPHGKWNSGTGYHKGDIGNFKVAADGEGIVTLATDEWCIGCGDETKDITGKAVVVHQGTDDFTSQPSGAAGARVSCAGIIE